MLTSDDLLYSYLRLLQDLSQAEAVSIFLPAVPEVPESSVLIHGGSSPAVPELADVEAAHRLASRAPLRTDVPYPTLRETLGAGTSPALRGTASQASGGMLIPVPADPLLETGARQPGAPQPGTPQPGAPQPGDESRHRRKAEGDATPALPAMWIGLRLAGGPVVRQGRAKTYDAPIEIAGSQKVWRRVLEHGATLSHHVHRIHESRRLHSELEEVRGALEETELVYGSPRMEALLETIRRVAPTDAGVLVTGASGTGKELVARTVHALSPRRRKPPVVVDCAAISASLIDSELFGHERGAYTGAAGRTVGRLAEAAGSTLILDEIGELPLEVQAKLLRFVQEKQITPVGSTRPRTVDVRLVAVTNRDLEEEVAAGRFRQDLYYRLKVIHAEVPALAERPEDVPLLMDYYVRRFSARYGKEVRGLTPQAAALAARHSWPGNVRELENRILQAVILCEGDEIGPQDLDLAEAVPVTGPGTLDLDLGQLEKRHIERVLESEDGSVTRAARRLGIQRNTLYQKIKKYGLER